MKNTTCQHCHLSFVIRSGSTGKFCSLSCSTIFNNAKRLAINIANYNINPMHCSHCNINLPYKKKKYKFCSASCSAKVTNNVQRKRGPDIKNFPYSEIKFLWCQHTNQWYSNRNRDGSLRKCSPYVKTIKEHYYSNARFKFNVYNYPNEFNLLLIEQYGWYSCSGKKRKGKPKNTAGVSRDHVMSVSYGFLNNIDPKIIAHPANCLIMLHSENKIKHGKCNITLQDLLQKINLWNEKYMERVTGVEPATNSLEG